MTSTLPEAMRTIDYQFYGVKTSIPVGRIMLVYLANNALMLDTARYLNVNNQRLRRTLSDYGCYLSRFRPRDQGALFQPQKIHDLADEYVRLNLDCEETQKLAARHKQAVEIGEQASEEMRHKNAKRGEPSHQPAARSSGFRRRKKAWWQALDDPSNQPLPIGHVCTSDEG